MIDASVLRQMIDDIKQIKKVLGINETQETNVQDGSVSNAKLADMAESSLKGRAAGAGAGDPQDLTPAQARTLLNVADGADATAAAVTSLAAKTPPVDADSVVITDSAASDAPKRTLLSSVKDFFKSYFDTLYGGLASANLWTGSLNTFGNGLGNAALVLDGAIGAARQLAFRSGGSNRWILQASTTAESGSNVGSDLQILSRTDAGGVLRTDLSIARSNGDWALGGSLQSPTIVTPTVASLANMQHDHQSGAGGGDLSANYVKIAGTQTVTGNKTFDGTTSMTGLFRSISITLADDTASSFVPPAIGGMVFIVCTNQQNAWGIASYRAAAYLTSIAEGTNMDFAAGTPTGTTGVDGQLTFFRDATSSVHLENRLGATRTFLLLFIT